MPGGRALSGVGRRSPTDRALTGEAEAVSCAEGARGAGGGTGGAGRASSSAVRKGRQAGYPGGARVTVEDSPTNSRNGVVRFGKGAYGLPRSTTFRCVGHPTRPRGAVPCANPSSRTGDVPSCPASSRASCCPWRISACPRSSSATPAVLSSDHSVVTTGRPGHRRGGLFSCAGMHPVGVHFSCCLSLLSAVGAHLSCACGEKHCLRGPTDTTPLYGSGDGGSTPSEGTWTLASRLLDVKEHQRA